MLRRCIGLQYVACEKRMSGELSADGRQLREDYMEHCLPAGKKRADFCFAEDYTRSCAHELGGNGAFLRGK